MEVDFTDKIKNIFDVCDTEGTGYITVEHLKSLAREHFGADSDEETIGIIHLLDPEGKGKVNFQDFCKGVEQIFEVQALSKQSGDLTPTNSGTHADFINSFLITDLSSSETQDASEASAYTFNEYDTTTDEDKEQLLIDFNTPETSRRNLFPSRGHSSGRSSISKTDEENFEDYGLGELESDSSDNLSTVGMGELNVVLNGVEFRTRHNDYRLRMPSTTTKDYNRMENVPYPAVPPAVLSKKTVNEQIIEMREWFRAFKEQDYSVRDYRPYFKPVLSVLEGGWTTNTKTLVEPFFSDRHHIDASSWFDLQEKVRYTSAAGSKDAHENYAYLPTTIMNVKDGLPEYAQWNYRIMAHPLKHDLPLKYFSQIDDLTFRMRKKKNMTQIEGSRLARYKIMPHANKHEGAYIWGKLDEMMYEVPGKDNYPGHIVRDEEQVFISSTYANRISLDVSKYHRWYKSNTKDAMGQTRIHRGFSDNSMFVAETTNPNIAPTYKKICQKQHGHHPPNCTYTGRRFTYAIPLEVVYLTPLLTWNPYNLHVAYNPNSAEGKAVSSNGRTGGFTVDKAYNGTTNRLYYITPHEFYKSSGGVGADRADTAKGVVGVLDSHGVVRNTSAAGNRIIIPEIQGVGRIRTRYPILPLHAEGGQTREELEAVKTMVMRMPTYSSLFEEVPTSVAKATEVFMETEHTLHVAPTTMDPPGLHEHTITIHQYDVEELKKGHIVRGLLTSVENGHMHSIDVKYVNGEYVMVHCDGMPTCWDHHSTHLTFED